MTVRFGTVPTKPDSRSATEIIVKTPHVDIPDAAVVSVALNGQQYIKEKILHFQDDENTFLFYQRPHIATFGPVSGPASGNTLIKIEGKGFLPAKYLNGTFKTSTSVWARFVGPDDRLVAPASKAVKVDNENVHWRTPAGPAGTNAALELSLNNEDFSKITIFEKDYSFSYFQAPEITSINPRFAPVRIPGGQFITVSGHNFHCPDAECRDLFCRFGSSPDEILLKAQRVSDEEVKCPIPKYPQPNVLNVRYPLNSRRDRGGASARFSWKSR